MVLRSGKNLLLYAVVLGLFAAGAAAWYVSRAEAAANPTESVVVARGTIGPRVTLSEDFLIVKRVPKGAVHPEAASSMEPFIGKTTKQTIAPGEQILASKLFRDRSESGASFVLPEGRRAMAITVNELIAAGGLIVPGDKVDVIGSCVVEAAEQLPPTTPQSLNSSPALAVGSGTSSNLVRTVYALQKLEVLAVAQNVVGEEALSPQDALRAQDSKSSLSLNRSSDLRPAAQTLTLALTPDESSKLILLENHPACSLRLALRPANDDSRTSTGVIDFNPVSSMDAIVK